MRIARLALLALVTILPACEGTDAQPKACTDPVAATKIEIADFAFEPDCLLAASGEGIRLENVGEAPHTFTVSGTEIGFDVQAGETVTGNLTGINPGLYSVKCVYHPQMTATLRINR